MELEKIPRIRLGRLPTPLERVDNLSKAVGVSHLYFKRDDLTGIGYGGNKIRKLEFLLADAVSKGADTIITTGGVHSNFTREATACAAKLGLKTVLVLTGDEPDEYRGNLFLERLMGAEIHFVSGDIEKSAQEAEDFMQLLAEDLERKGRTGYIMPVGGSTPVGTIGFVNAFLELESQVKDLGITVDHLITATGSGGTQAGLMVGKEISHSNTRITGIRVGKTEPFLQMIADKATKTAEYLGMKRRFSERDVIACADFVGEGYDMPTTEAADAIKLVARKEAIFLDPVYTGKAMAGLLGLVERGEISKEDTIVFWHTGGDPALFVGEELLGKKFMESLRGKEAPEKLSKR